MSYSKLVFTPLSYTGWGSLNELLPEVKKHKASKVLLVTDPTLLSIGLVDRVTSPLEKEGYSVTVFSEIVPEPPVKTAEALVQFTKAGHFDLVIGLGGGSALDLAKLTAVLSAHEGQVKDYLNLSGTKKITEKGLPKILIPTTSGTGSEVTNISVLSLEDTKDVVTHDFLLADAAIVDPELTLTLPARVTAATGVDALTHAIEAYVSVHANPATDGLALHAIRLISRSIRTAVSNGADKQARIDMSYGSYIAGSAFFNAGVAGVHALAYPLGGQFHLPHGESNAVLLPYVMGYIRKSCESRMADIYKALGGNDFNMTEGAMAIACVDELQNLVKDVAIPATLSEFGIPEVALSKLTDDAIKQTRLLSRSPLPLGEKDIYTIYKAAFEGIIVEPTEFYSK